MCSLRTLWKPWVLLWQNKAQQQQPEPTLQHSHTEFHGWNVNRKETWCCVLTMQCFPHYWPFVRGIHFSSVDSPHKGPVMWGLDVVFVVSLNKLLNKQLRHSWWWYEMPWHKSDITVMLLMNKDSWKGMMTSSNGNIFSVTGPLRGEFTGHR